MATITLTQAATAAAQLLEVIDSGESLATAQLADALFFANNLLASWYQEQQLALQTLIQEQIATFNPILSAYTLAGGSYTPPIYTPGTIQQFPDNITAITLPAGYNRAFTLNLAIEMAGYWNTPASAELKTQAAEARAAASPVPRRLPVPGSYGQRTIQGGSDIPTPAGG